MGIWKDMVVANFSVLSLHLPGEAEENRDKPWSG